MPKFESRYHLAYKPEALELAVKLGERHFPKGPQPETALNILDEDGGRPGLDLVFAIPLLD